MTDGLPGPDLTGWGACFESPSGEMFFGGFSGSTAFFPDEVTSASYTPPIVLTDLRLPGNSAERGSDFSLQRSVSYTSDLVLSQKQNVFSLGFAALSYSNSATNRYRYKLEGLERDWNEVGSDHRQATYTTLPVGTYTFRVQGAISGGAWSEPGLAVRVEILPPWWKTWWFRASYVAAFLGLLWALYRYRLHQIAQEFNVRLEERLNERTRIARELHDTLLQSFQGLVLRFQGARNLLPTRTADGLKMLDAALEQAEEAITESRDAIHNMRLSTLVRNDLSEALRAVGDELAAGHASQFRLVVEGSPRDVHAVVHDEVYLIAREAIRNAFCHAEAKVIEAEITYGTSLLRLCVRDDGNGIDPAIVRDARTGHYGLPGMRERAAGFGGRLNIWSGPGAGTEIELNIPGSKAYGTSGEVSVLRLFRRRGDSKKGGSTNGPPK